MAQSRWRSTCCNPFNKSNHNAKQKYLRPVTRGICEQAANISVGMSVCDSCRKALPRTPACLPEVESQPSVIPEPESSSQSGSPRSQSLPYSEKLQFEASMSLKQMNQYLEDVGKHQLQERSYDARGTLTSNWTR